MPADNLRELFYWVDEEDNILGKISREEAHNGSMKIHRTVGIFVEDKQENILLQQRSLQKDLDPGHWTISSGGHVGYGREYEESAYQELKEELGIHSPLQFIKKVFVETNAQREWVSLYKTIVPHEQEWDTDLDEVEQVRWVAKKDISKFIEDQQFSPWAKIALHMIGYI